MESLRKGVKEIGKSVEQLEKEFPLISKIRAGLPVYWKNNDKKASKALLAGLPFTKSDLQQAEKSWLKFAPLLECLFPQLKVTGGIIESKLKPISTMKSELVGIYRQEIPGNLFLKGDHQLPIAGSVKARGGIYAVLKYAERLAVANGLLEQGDNYSKIAAESCRKYFSRYRIEVGSTGNLGLSIGIMASALGFQVTVHMSNDAKEWKKKLLRGKGVVVHEYDNDYTEAVAKGRESARSNPVSYFIDDENSADLFLGYSVAALRLKEQLSRAGITVDHKNPLFVYLPCGVGGAPGGITFGLKHVYGDDAYCFFVEPTHSPSMLLGLLTKEYEGIKVQDYGIDNRTVADGLAVASPSPLVSRIIGGLVDGIYTITDQQLYILLAIGKESEGIEIEPSAAAGLLGPVLISRFGKDYLNDQFDSVTHLAWATGGALLPAENMLEYYHTGKGLLKRSQVVLDY
ncbi:MAG: D-serine ammonia-lyase [Halanaerobiales bacterium]|nr:D-serine ammonia-lyase [Halanaerobiales bacterium]